MNKPRQPLCPADPIDASDICVNVSIRAANGEIVGCHAHGDPGETVETVMDHVKRRVIDKLAEEV